MNNKNNLSYCIICFNVGRKLKYVDAMKWIYQDILQIQVLGSDCLRVCNYCECMLMKFQRFIRLVEKSYLTLSQNLYKSNQLSLYQYNNLTIEKCTAHDIKPTKYDIDWHDMELITAEPLNHIHNYDMSTTKQEITNNSDDNEFDYTDTYVRSDQDEFKIELREDNVQIIEFNVEADLKDESRLKDGRRKSCTKSKQPSSVYNCDKCPLMFSSRATRKYHVKSRHQVLPECDCCNKKFMSKSSLIDHLNGYRRNAKRAVRCPECDKLFTRSQNLNDHLKLHKSERTFYECKLCFRKFGWKNNLFRHMRKHRSQETGGYRCDPCNRRYSSLETYRQHLKGTKLHGGTPIYTTRRTKKEFICDTCGKSYTSRPRLIDHMDWEHTKLIKYKCAQCHSVYQTQSTLLQHVKIHTDSSNHLCHLCGKAYKNEMSLRVHLSQKHYDSKKSIGQPLRRSKKSINDDKMNVQR